MLVSSKEIWLGSFTLANITEVSLAKMTASEAKAVLSLANSTRQQYIDSMGPGIMFRSSPPTHAMQKFA